MTKLAADVVYSIRVFAMNSIGESNSSNEVQYTRLQGQLIRCLRAELSILILVLPIHAGGSVDAQTLAISIGSSVAGFFLVVLCLAVVAGKLVIYMCTVNSLRSCDSCIFGSIVPLSSSAKEGANKSVVYVWSRS